MVIFQICKSIVPVSLISVVSKERVSELAEPIQPHRLTSGSGPVVSFPGNASSIFAESIPRAIQKHNRSPQ